ncbi:ephrin-A3-like [Scyliorhinus torazame]|uniref:ephrin-A3-like n=1 Tax=Scyliorhinus torazame TaxID=75743 RepID=UPI003B591DA1
MKVLVCCATSSHPSEKEVPTPPQFTVGHDMKTIEDLETFKPEVPKLEKSVSGSSPSRKHLKVTVVLALLLLLTLLAS